MPRHHSLLAAMSLPHVMILAGTDPTGGAGLAADIRTVTAMGAFPMPAVTCVTAQNHKGLAAMEPVSVDMIAGQLKAIYDVFTPDAVKIGMLTSADAVSAVAEIMTKQRQRNIVVDPVLGATAGGAFSHDMPKLIEAYLNDLLPIATLVTPNIPEARKFRITDSDEGVLHTCNILLKGGHAEDEECMDRLITVEGSTVTFRGRRIDSSNLHGTGCVLSSAIASGLAKGLELTEAIKCAKDFLTRAIVLSADADDFPVYGPALLDIPK